MTVQRESVQEYTRKLINNLRCACNIIKEHAEIEKVRQGKI